MNEAFLCRNVLVCDEIREEVGGKQLIIGAYAGVILIPFLPFFSPKISVRFEIKVDKPHYDHAECTVFRPNGSIFYHDTRAFDIRYPEFATAIIFVLNGLIFEHTGEYALLLAMDSAPMAVGNFSIVTPEQIPQRG
jgi:hypothetical protein